LAAALGAIAVPAEAATPSARRLTVQIDGLRQGHLQQGADRGRQYGGAHKRRGPEAAAGWRGWEARHR
jgi:hypothetical protein